MSLSFYTIASGSSGNSYLIYTDETKILLDVGVSGKKILESLSLLGESSNSIDAILLTHEHTDHVKSIKKMAKITENSMVYCSTGTYSVIDDKVSNDKLSVVNSGDRFYIGDILVTAFELSHDAKEPLGYSFEVRNQRITVITDSGLITDEIMELVIDTDLLVLESNYEHNILMMGSYPYSLKQRIIGQEGHLSNEDAGKCISLMLEKRIKSKAPIVRLAHLSRENNTPKQAYLTIINMLEECGFLRGRDYDLDVFPQGEEGPIISLKGM